MPKYTDFIDRILRTPGLLKKLTPTEPLAWDLPSQITQADEATLAGPAPTKSAALIRGGLHYAVDALEKAHAHFQDDTSDLASYWHGMMHRREGDFDNARYWYRRAGRLPIAATLHAAACEHSPTMARQDTWDAYLLTGLCEQVKHGDPDLLPECIKLQTVEFEGLFAYTWRKMQQTQSAK
jgi:hypothetical protein